MAGLPTITGDLEQRGGQRVLVVDDEPSLRHLLAFHLGRTGHDVSEAASAEAVLRLVESERPDLVLLDLVLPGGDATEVLRRLRASRPDLPVIVLTGGGGLEQALAAMRLGAFDFLTKPLDVDRLLIAVRNALSFGSLARRLVSLEQELQCAGLTTRPPAPASAVVPLDEVERAHILRAVEACRGNLSQAARLLDIGRTTLYRKLQRYGVMGGAEALAGAVPAHLDA